MDIFRLIHTSSSVYNTGAQLPTPPPDDIIFARSNSHCNSDRDTEMGDMDMTFDMDLDEEVVVNKGDNGDQRDKVDKAGDVRRGDRGDMRSPDSIPDLSKEGRDIGGADGVTTKEEEEEVTKNRDLDRDQETRNEILRNDIMPPDEMDPKAGTELLFDKIKILGYVIAPSLPRDPAMCMRALCAANSTDMDMLRYGYANVATALRHYLGRGRFRQFGNPLPPTTPQGLRVSGFIAHTYTDIMATTLQACLTEWL
jgi:hypothetical protein